MCPVIPNTVTLSGARSSASTDLSRFRIGNPGHPPGFSFLGADFFGQGRVCITAADSNLDRPIGPIGAGTISAHARIFCAGTREAAPSLGLLDLLRRSSTRPWCNGCRGAQAVAAPISIAPQITAFPWPPFQLSGGCTFPAPAYPAFVLENNCGLRKQPFAEQARLRRAGDAPAARLRCRSRAPQARGEGDVG